VRSCKIISILILILILFSACNFISSTSPGLKIISNVITVNDDGGADYTRINDALKVAKSGDTIIVQAGTYNENIIIKVPITLKGAGYDETFVVGWDWDDVLKITVDNVNVSGFTFTGSGSNYYDAGIELNSVDNCKIENNNCSNNYHGIYLIKSSSNSITGNICDLNEKSGIMFYSSGGNSDLNLIDNNTCRDNNENGIVCTYNNNEINNNTCDSNKNYGISIGGTSNIAINNTCTNNSINGIVITGSSHAIIKNSCSYNNNSGISNTGNLNTIIDNYLTKNQKGITLSNNERNNLFNNNCTLNLNYGIYLKNSKLNLIKNNTIRRNSNGIYLYSNSSHNNIYENLVFKNNYTGIKLFQDCFFNKIYHNNIIGNLVQGVDQDNPINHWYHISIEEGNHWSDYTGLDNGFNGSVLGDGIGDTATPHLGMDEYPFIKPSGWIFPGIPILENPGIINPDGNYNVSWSEVRDGLGYVLEESMEISFNVSKVLYNGKNLTFGIKNQTNGQFFYRVKAYNSDFESPWSNIENISVNFPPMVPMNFHVSVYLDGNALNLSWDLNLDDTVEYKLEYLLNNTNSWEQLATIPHPANGYDHIGLLNGERYSYRLQAMDAVNQESGFSKKISAIPRDSMAPAVPSGLMVKGITNRTVSLAWEANTEIDLKGYNIYRSTLPNTTVWSKPINGDDPLNMNSYIDKNLDEMTTYYYVITACDEVPNESDFSKMVYGTTLSIQYGPEINNPQLDFEIPEDTIDEDTINLQDWFSDVNNDILEFQCSGQKNLNVKINQETGKVIIEPKQDWNGQETLIFSASDGTFQVSDDVVITVTAVNDPPKNIQIINPTNEFITNDSTQIDFIGRCDDPDLNYGDELVFWWVTNTSTILSKKETFNAVLAVGFYKITLTVVDSHGISLNDSVNISILRTPESKSPEIPELPGDENETDAAKKKDYLILYIVLTVGVVIIILLLMVLNFLTKKDKFDLEKDDKEQNKLLEKKKKEKKKKIKKVVKVKQKGKK
jgi:parallel beta-helix repeat protein